MYRCPICGTNYDNLEAAESCIIKEDPPICEVGDIVEAKYGFGWYDGNKDWIINPQIDPSARHGFGPKESWGFYYVVTAIDNDRHRTRYHLATLAMTGNDGYHGGYTFNSGHHRPKIVDTVSASIIESSKSLIGKKFEFLL